MKLFIAVLLSVQALGTTCSLWSSPKVIGQLDTDIVNESSGIAFSTQYNDRLYHINDSGDGPFFYQTSLAGENTKKIRIKNFNPKDVEDLAYGDCPGGKCLIIADIGDNPSKRSFVTLAIVKEKENFDKSVDAQFVKMKYPDGAHNVEGVALHPNGNIYIVTKEHDYINQRALPAQIFELHSSQWKEEKTETQTLKHIGSIDLPFHLFYYNLFGRLVTGLDISKDGSKLLVLTYKAALEINLDLGKVSFPNSRALIYDKDYSVVELNKMPQQEAIAYLDEKSFIFTTEYKKKFGQAPIQKVTCLK